jgi:hypothetical protein
MLTPPTRPGHATDIERTQRMNVARTSAAHTSAAHTRFTAASTPGGRGAKRTSFALGAPIALSDFERSREGL